jgi:hypothetical protein
MFRSFSPQPLTVDKIFLALGNERPQILVQLEDCILETIMAISEGTSRENSMQKLYSELLCLEKTLTGDKDALTWFDLLKEDSDIPSNLPPSTSSAGSSNLLLLLLLLYSCII